MAKNPMGGSPLTESFFNAAESGMKLNKIGNGSYSLDLHGAGGMGKRMSGKVQTPAQHAAVKRAALKSVANRKARAL